MRRSDQSACTKRVSSGVVTRPRRPSRSSGQSSSSRGRRSSGAPPPTPAVARVPPARSHPSRVGRGRARIELGAAARSLALGGCRDHVAGVRVREALAGWLEMRGAVRPHGPRARPDARRGAVRRGAAPRTPRRRSSSAGRRCLSSWRGVVRGRESRARHRLSSAGASWSASGSSSPRRPSWASLRATTAVTVFVTLAARNASSAAGHGRPVGHGCPAEPAHWRPARGASMRASAPGAPAATCASTAAWSSADMTEASLRRALGLPSRSVDTGWLAPARGRP